MNAANEMLLFRIVDDILRKKINGEIWLFLELYLCTSVYLKERNCVFTGLKSNRIYWLLAENVKLKSIN